MWARYRRTFVPVQVFIVGAAAFVLFMTRSPAAAGQLFVVMQLFALIGARWAARLRDAIEANARRLPLRGAK